MPREHARAAAETRGGAAIGVYVVVWLRRAIFGLSAHPSVKVLMDALAHRGAVRPCRAPLASDGSIRASPRPGDDNDDAETATANAGGVASGGGGGASSGFDFTIPGLLHAAESHGLALPEGFAPKGLARGVTLRHYQLQSLHWMREQEARPTTYGR